MVHTASQCATRCHCCHSQLGRLLPETCGIALHRVQIVGGTFGFINSALRLEVSIIEPIFRQVLWVHQKFRVACQDFLVLLRANECVAPLGPFLGWDEFCSHVGWPEVCRGVPCSTKSFLKLAWVEQIHKSRWGSFGCKHYLLLCLIVDEHLDAFVEESLTPAHRCVEAAEEEVHQVGLTQIAESQDLFTRKCSHRHVVQVANSDPLLDLTRQKQDSLDVHKEVAEHLIEHFRCDHLRLLFSHLGHDSSIHDEAGAIPLITSMQVKAARLQQSNCIVR